MTFPDQKPSSAEAFCDDYFAELSRAASSIDRAKLQIIAEVLQKAYSAGKTVFVCGNGGSAALANQMVCDHLKSIRSHTDLRPRLISLVTTMELMTATANDGEYGDVFELPLSSLAQTGDILFTISASGNSPNIVRAMEWAKSAGLTVISLTGFNGGRSSEIADYNLHVEAENYGIIEDLHQSITHILTQYIRATNLTNPDEIATIKF